MGGAGCRTRVPDFGTLVLGTRWETLHSGCRARVLALGTAWAKAVLAAESLQVWLKSSLPTLEDYTASGASANSLVSCKRCSLRF